MVPVVRFKHLLLGRLLGGVDLSWILLSSYSSCPTIGYLCLTCLLIISCGKQVVVPVAPEPDWLQQPPANTNFYYGIGGPAKTMGEAKEIARAELARAIEVQIESEITLKMEESNQNVNRLFVDRSRSYATRKLPDVQLEQHEGEIGNYALARVRRSIVQKLLVEATEQAQLEVSAYQENGHNALKTGNLNFALGQYQQALEIAKTLPLDYNRLDEGLWTAQIERQMTEIRNNLELHIISGDNQSGIYGSSLAEPIVVQMQINQMPIPNLPLQVQFASGLGELKGNSGKSGSSIQIETNPQGKATFSVILIESLSKQNQIQVSMANQDFGTRKVLATYASDLHHFEQNQQPTIVLNGSTNQQDFSVNSRVPFQVTVAQTCYLYLFQITADSSLVPLESILLNQAYQQDEWRVYQIGSGWSLEIDAVDITADYGYGLETLIAVTTNQPWADADGMSSVTDMLSELNRDFGNDWQANWVSYRIVR